MMDSIVDDQENLRDFLQEAELQQYYELFRDILKVSKLSQLKFVAIEDLAQIGLSRPEQRRYKKIYSKFFPNSYITKLKKLLNVNKRNELNKHGQIFIPMDFQSFSDLNVKVPTKHIISIEDITINKELGMGQFGVVQQGTWTTGNQRLQVAIKCLGNERMTSNSTEFLKEAAVMHSIDHPNIVRLYGVVLHMDSLMLVTELAPLRSLLECLREVTLRSNFSVGVLCSFAEQICDGMTYLENKRLIHRDLAARNILVFSKDRVKISDFGLSRALGVGKDYYQTNYNVNLKLPVAWCAPECILYLKFTSSSDVWAFGVCLWEMFTYGFQPWAAFSGQQILEAIDAPNFQRLERPECCPDAYYSLMLECWSHDLNSRPKFKDLCTRLRQIRPDEVQATVNYKKPEDGRRCNFLEYKVGQRITVLARESFTKSAMWYGVLPGGACGFFDPNNTQPYVNTEPPRQIVTPYKPSEDLEEVPLINPNSPSHLTATTSTSPYPLLSSNKPRADCDEVDLSYDDGKSRASKKQHKSILESTTSKSLLSKVKSATLGRAHKTEDITKNDEVHEYHEISDTDAESVIAEMRGDGLTESPEMRGCTDFSQSLLDEMETIFRSLDNRQDEDVRSKHSEIEAALRLHTLGKKKGFTGSMKPMSAHEEKTLNTAVALANEITSKSMNDLENDKTPLTAPGERSKFPFKFPLVSSLHHVTHHETEKEAADKAERRNFSEEAKSVPDIQATITKESKQAYESLIENPLPATSLISQISQDMPSSAPKLEPKMMTIPKPAPRQNPGRFHSLQMQIPYKLRSHSAEVSRAHSNENVNFQNLNVLPLPPRGSKPVLVDKPRHIRKYPLKMPNEAEVNVRAPIVIVTPPQEKPPAALYQNTVSCAIPMNKMPIKREAPKNTGTDVFDGPVKVHTNPFTSVPTTVRASKETPGPSSVNPFQFFLEDNASNQTSTGEKQEKLEKDFEKLSLAKDHVSVEDLLEFADKKPSARQRGAESDEVRIMNKVLKQQVTPKECLEALEFSGWNVHMAIKLLRVKIAVGDASVVSLEDCRRELDNADGDIVKASAVLVYNKNNEEYMFFSFQ